MKLRAVFVFFAIIYSMWNIFFTFPADVIRDWADK